MRRDELNDLSAFVAIADERNFTRAAARLGMSPSALSHAMRTLETRHGVKLLARTTRSVAPTEAGERLLEVLRPAFEEIGAGLQTLGHLRDKPAGTLRITTFRHAAATVLWPVLPDFLTAYPDMRVEISVDDGLTDIVASRFDAGIRWGEKVARDMIAVRVSPAIRSIVVGSPAYFTAHPPPVAPQDLSQHCCINYRMKTAGGLYPWEFEKDGRPLQVKVEGPLILNDEDMILTAALAGQGLALLYENQVARHVAAGRLVQVLTDWCRAFPGYFLYYPNRRQVSPALTALVAALRARLTTERPEPRDI